MTNNRIKLAAIGDLLLTSDPNEETNGRGLEALSPEIKELFSNCDLVLANLERMRQRGVEVAVLGTSSRNVAMLQLAETTGFRVRSTRLWFGKPVVPDASTGAASYY